MSSSRRPSRPEARLRSLLAVAALGLISACGNGNVPGVSVIDAQTDVVFGNTDKPTAAPTSTGPFVPQGPGIGLPPLPTLPPLNFHHQPPYKFPDSVQPVRNSFCAGPPLFATAPQAATTAVQGQPDTGFYLWQLLTSQEVKPKVVIKTAKYANYEVRNVSAITTRPNPQGDQTTTFTYDQVAQLAGGGTLTTTYQVKQNAPGANVGNVGNIGTARRVSEPDAGLAIKAEVLRDSGGATKGSFNPVVPVLILPLPIVGGASFNGAGTDPTTGSSMSVQGTVKGVDRVTGCTDYVQGYRVDAMVTSSGTDGQAGPSEAQTYIVETQRGGLVVGNSQTPTNSTTTYSSVIGDTKPSKSPKSIPKELQP